MKRFLSFLMAVVVASVAVPAIEVRADFGRGTVDSVEGEATRDITEKAKGLAEKTKGYFGGLLEKVDGSCVGIFNMSCTDKAKQMFSSVKTDIASVKKFGGLLYEEKSENVEETLKNAQEGKWAFSVLLGLSGLGLLVVVANLLQCLVGF